MELPRRVRSLVCVSVRRPSAGLLELCPNYFSRTLTHSATRALSRSLSVSRRAVVVFDVELEGIEIRDAPRVLTPDIVSVRPFVFQLYSYASLMHSYSQAMKKWNDIALEEKWQNFGTRLQIRDACPIGREHYRYDGDMLDYFFPISAPSTSVLQRIRGAESSPAALAPS